MTTITRRQFNQGLMAGIGTSLHSGVLGAKSSQGMQQPASAGCITDVPGIKAGHYTDTRRPTGCTALLFEGKATAGVDYDGSAPGSHLGVMLQPVSPVDMPIHGILLSGGGPLGLAAVTGVNRYLEEHTIGLDWGIPNVRIPIVIGAVIDDLSLGDGRIRPDEIPGIRRARRHLPRNLKKVMLARVPGRPSGKCSRTRGTKA